MAIADARLVQIPVEGLHPTRSAEVIVGDELVGAVGEIDPVVLDRFGITERVAWLEVDLDALLAKPHGDRPYTLVSRYPSSDIDLAFEVDDTTPADDVARAIEGAAGDLLVSLDLFDVFRGGSVTEGRRSLAYNLRLQAPDRTLTDDDVALVRQRIIDDVERTLPAKLRG
jgi:phenylalanyl-tRNA synthetase beta chain